MAWLSLTELDKLWSWDQIGWFSVIMVLASLPSDALSQHLPSHLGFSYLGRGVSLHGCSSNAQPLVLTLDEGYLRTATPPDLERGEVLSALLSPAAVAPWRWGCSSRPPFLLGRSLALS